MTARLVRVVCTIKDLIGKESKSHLNSTMLRMERLILRSTTIINKAKKHDVG